MAASSGPARLVGRQLKLGSRVGFSRVPSGDGAVEVTLRAATPRAGAAAAALWAGAQLLLGLADGAGNEGAQERAAVGGEEPQHALPSALQQSRRQQQRKQGCRAIVPGGREPSEQRRRKRAYQLACQRRGVEKNSSAIQGGWPWAT